MSEQTSFTVSLTAMLPEPTDVSDTKANEQESRLNSSGNTPRDSPSPPIDHDSALETADLLSPRLSHVDSTSTLFSGSEKESSLVNSLIIEPISNIVVVPTTTPQLGNLW